MPAYVQIETAQIGFVQEGIVVNLGKTLRRKLGTFGDRFEAVWGVGYRYRTG